MGDCRSSRGGEYRAIGKYLEIDLHEKLVFIFKMPQFSKLEDVITVELKELQQGCEMTFSQEIKVPREENWTESDLEKALGESRDGTEYGWSLMFMGLEKLVITGKISCQG